MFLVAPPYIQVVPKHVEVVPPYVHGGGGNFDCNMRLAHAHQEILQRYWTQIISIQLHDSFVMVPLESISLHLDIYFY